MAAIYTLYRNWNSSDDELYDDTLMPGAVFPDITDVGGLDWTKSGAVFNNWNTSQDGTGTAYAVGDSISVRGDYYAIWAESTHDITVSYNGGTIFEMDASGTEVFETNGRIMRSDLTIDYVKPEPKLQSKSATPSTSAQTITPNTGYDGLSSVSIAAMPLGTAGTPIATKGSVSNHSISVTPSVTNSVGYINSGTKTGTAVTVSASELVSGTRTITANATGIDVTNYASVDVDVSMAPSLQSKTVTPTPAAQLVLADSGYDGLLQVTVNGMPTGSATAPATINVTDATISPGNNQVTFSKTVSVTPNVTPGYVANGTAGNCEIYLTATARTKPATTYTPTTIDQTISSRTYLTGVQTIKGDANLLAENIKKDVEIFGITGTLEGGGSSSPTLTPFIPQYVQNVGSVLYTSTYDYVPAYYVPAVGQTIRMHTEGRWELSSLYEEGTGTPVPFTVISTSKYGSDFEFVMPNTNVIFDLYYND